MWGRMIQVVIGESEKKGIAYVIKRVAFTRKLAEARLRVFASCITLS